MEVVKICGKGRLNRDEAGRRPQCIRRAYLEQPVRLLSAERRAKAALIGYRLPGVPRHEQHAAAIAPAEALTTL
jgi:hypothetical protein